MKKWVVFLLLGLPFCQMAFSQTNDLSVMSAAGKLYLVHTVEPRENWYSVGRLYNISPKEIAPFNGTTLDKPLNIGESLNIPLEATNFSQDGLKAVDESFVAVYHVVQDKESLVKISQNYNNVPLAMLEKWNRLGKDQPKKGARLIVGYLKVKPLLSALAKGGKEKVDMVAAPKKELPADNNPVASIEKKPDPKQVIPVPEKKPSYNATPVSSHTGGSYFSSEYNEGSKHSGGLAGIFKSTSGWQDGKYYALVNNVAVGTIVKVNNPSTNKTIYAKVLGPLPDMKESAGLAIRISNAAASELGAGEDGFNVEVSY